MTHKEEGQWEPVEHRFYADHCFNYYEAAGSQQSPMAGNRKEDGLVSQPEIESSREEGEIEATEPAEKLENGCHND